MGPTRDMLNQVCWLIYKCGPLVNQKRLLRVKRYLLRRMERRHG